MNNNTTVRTLVHGPNLAFGPMDQEGGAWTTDLDQAPRRSGSQAVIIEHVTAMVHMDHGMDQVWTKRVKKWSNPMDQGGAT